MKAIAIILTFFLFINVPLKVIACSCVGAPTVKDALKYSDVVFAGTVMKKQIETMLDSAVLKMFPNDTAMQNSPMVKKTIARYEFIVQILIKGKIIDNIVSIYTGLGGGDCGFEFKEGETYIVYGDTGSYFGQLYNTNQVAKPGIFWTNICSRTRAFAEAEMTSIENAIKESAVEARRCTFKIDTLAILKDKNLPGFIKHISSNSFNLYKDKKHIPSAWMQQLDCLTDGFHIANPEEDFSNSCTDPDSLPPRRLDLLLTSKNLMVMTYELGQGAAGVIGVIMFCRFSKNKMIDLWTGFTWDRLKSKEEILNYIKQSEEQKFMRHSDFLYF